MAQFKVTAPDGKSYKVVAPDDSTPEELSAYVERNIMGGPAVESMGQDGVTSSGQNYTFAHSGNRPGTLETGARSILQGLTLGYGDEAVAAGAATVDPLIHGSGGTWKDRYEAYRGRERGRMAAGRQDSPITSIGGEVAGAALPVVLTGGMTGGSTVLGRMAAGAGTGAAQGGIMGFGAGEGGLGNRLEGAAYGAGLGGTVGALAPAFGGAAGAGTRHIASGGAARELGVSRPAYNILSRTMSADDSLTGQGAQRMAAVGPGAMLADAGPNARSILDTVIQRSGPAAQVARDAVEGRASQASGQIAGAMDSTFGPARGVATVERELRVGSAPARRSAYDAAYEKPLDYASEQGKQIEALINDRVPGEAIKKANALMRAEGHRSNQILADVADDGTVTFKTLPDVRQLDYITRGLNEVADAADGAGKLGGQTQIGRAYGNLAKDIRGLVRQAVPEYGIALDTAAEPIAARNALRLGEKLLSPSLARDEVAQAVKGMSKSEKDSLSQGIRSQFDEALANVKRAVTDGNMDAREAVKAVRDLSSRANREKVAIVVGDDAADKLFSQVDRAAAALDLRAGMAQNSKTFARTSMDDSLRGMTDDGFLNALRSGEPVNALKRLAQVLGNRTPAAKEAIYDNVQMELARALTGPNGQQTLQRLAVSAGRPNAIAGSAQRLAEALARQNTAVSGPGLNYVTR